MNKGKKTRYSIGIGIIILSVAMIFIMSNLGKDGNKIMNVKTDKEAIISRFPNIGEFTKCYWNADLIVKSDKARVPGPSSYWMKGFVEIDKDKVSAFIEKYNMQQLSVAPKLEFLPDNFDASISKWFYSEIFNDYIKQPSFLGKFYIDAVNNVIYFEVTK